MNITEKKKKLQEILSEFSSIAVAYSGGIDSSLILKLSSSLNKNTAAFIVKTYFTSEMDYNDGVDFCTKNKIKYKIITPEENQFEQIKTNPLNRCYLCKKIIFNTIIKEAVLEGYTTIIDGTNASDSGDYRPGKQALKELGIISPFILSEITKEDIREISREENIDFYDKPSNSCLLTRIPYDSEITREKISQIEKGEKFIRDLGIKVVRLRHFNEIAVIEIGKDERNKLFNTSLLDRIKEYLSSLGFDYTAIEAGGYKTGNMNNFLDKNINYG